MVQENQSLEDLDQYLADYIQVYPFIVLGFNETIQVKTKHLSDDANMASELKISLNLNNILAG